MGTVKRLPRDPGPAGWDAILPPGRRYPTLDGRANADWLVIGAGFAGLSAARRLAQLHPGERITVLEAACVASGPAGRNSGFMIDVPHDLASDDYGGDLAADRAQIELNRLGIGFAERVARDFGLAAETFARCGKVNGAASERGIEHNAAYARHLARLGEPHEMLDARAMRALTGTDYYVGGLYSPGTAMIQPALYIRGLAAGTVSNRVSLHESSPVTALDRVGSSWRATTPHGSVSAPRVLLAVNGHAESFGFFERRLMHVFTYASMTRALSLDEVQRLGGEARWALTPAHPLGTTVRRIYGTGGARIIVRNRATFEPSMEAGPQRMAEAARTQDRAFAARFPMLGDVTMEYRWGGRLCLSRNNVAAFGELEPGMFAACCQNGLGTARGTATGVLAAEQASGVESELLAQLLEADAPSRLPPPLLTRVGATARIRWGEARAGREL